MRVERARSSESETRGHEHVEHTSEMTLRVRGPSFEALIEEATRAFVELVPERIRGPITTEARDFRLDAPDRAALLVDWLNELVYLGEAEAWLPAQVDVEAADEGGVLVRATPMRLTEPFVLVKAATLHGAVVRKTERGLEAEVTLDI